MRLFIIIIFFFCSIASNSKNSKIKELERQRKSTLREIENTNRLLLDTKKTTASLLDRIKLISSQISSRQNLISILNQEVKSIEDEQKRTIDEVNVLEKELKVQTDNYAQAVNKVIYKKQNNNRLLFVLSGKSFSESLRRMQYLKEYATWRNQQALDIKTKKAELDEKKAALEKSRAEKIERLKEREKEREKLKSEENLHQQEVSEVKNVQKELQQTLQQKQKQADALNRQIEKLIAEEVARQEREARRIAQEKARIEKEKERKRRQELEKKKEREKERRRSEQSNKSTAERNTVKEKEVEENVKEKDVIEEASSSPAPVTRENYNLSNNFALNKGKFPMPVNGKYTIINRFGTNHNNQWNIATNSNGIDIRAQSGADAICIFNGEVSRVVAFPGFNNCVIIRHGGYYTFYGNIKQVYIKQGQKTTTGQSIGKIYTDSDTGGTQLHFQLWKGTTKLNPESWLKK